MVILSSPYLQTIYNTIELSLGIRDLAGELSYFDCVEPPELILP